MRWLEVEMLKVKEKIITQIVSAIVMTSALVTDMFLFYIADRYSIILNTT